MKTLLALLLISGSLLAATVPNGGFEDNPQASASITPWQANSGSRIALTGCSITSGSNGSNVSCANTRSLTAGMIISGAGLVTNPPNATLLVALPITSTSFGVTGGTITTCPASLLVTYTLPPPSLTITRSTVAPHSGTFSLRVDGRDSPVDGVRQSINLVNGATYTTRFAVKPDAQVQVRCFALVPGSSQLVILAEIVVDNLHASTWVQAEGTATLSWSGTQTAVTIFFQVDQVYGQGTQAPAGVFPGFNLDSIDIEIDSDGDGWWDSEEGPGKTGTSPTNADSDGDTLPDKWESTHQLNPNDITDAAHDDDGDGHTNLIEYWANTDPQSKASYPGKTSDSQASPATKALLYYLQTRGARTGRYLTGHHAQDIAGGDYTSYVAGLNALMTAAGYSTWVSILSIAAEGPSALQPLQIATSAQVLRDYMDAGGLGLIHFTPRNPWTNGGNGDKTGVNITALLTPGTTENLRMTGWMDAIAAEIAAFGPDRPVIFRPFSEQNGGWNWYGRLPRDEFILLYRWMRSYFVDTKDLHNIIWTIEHHIGAHRAASSTNLGVMMDYYYPGDDVIDLVGFSCYISGWNPGFDANAQSRLHPKALAITEGGPPANEDDVPNAYNTLYLNALDTWYRRAAFFVIWNSWNTGPFVSIKDNAGYEPLLTDPRVTNREAVNYLHTTARWQSENDLLNEPLEGDADHDSNANIIEAAMGFDPLTANGALVTQGMITSGNNTYSTITFTRDISVTDLTLTVQWSPDLVNWSTGSSYGPGGIVATNAITTEVSRTQAGSIETITVRSNSPVSTGEQFMRVQVDGH